MNPVYRRSRIFNSRPHAKNGEEKPKAEPRETEGNMEKERSRLERRETKDNQNTHEAEIQTRNGQGERRVTRLDWRQ